MSKEINVKTWKQFLNENKIVNDFTEKEIDIIFDNAKKYITKNNDTENYYHNNEHLLNVFKKSMTLFDEYKDEYKLNSVDKICLGLAALFHDYAHSGGKLKDDENVEIALDELKKYLVIIDKPYLYNTINKIIKVTEFPHKDVDLDILQKIIRDADTMGGIIDGWVYVVKSLAKEYNKSLKDFIPTQIAFIESVKFNTDYCNKILKSNKEKIIEELKKMLIEI